MYLCYTMQRTQEFVPIPNYTGDNNLYEKYGLVGKDVYDKNKNYIGKLTFTHPSGGIVTKETSVNFRDDYFFKLKSVPNNKMIQDIANDLFGGKRRRKTNRRNTNRRKTNRRKTKRRK